MPNWITNVLVCDDYEALKSIVNDEGQVDFNTIIPMPDYIRNTVVGSTVEYSDGVTRRPLTHEEIEKGAGKGWYDWSVENWGCKWNASETKELDLDIFAFQTPWRPPVEFLKALSAKYPNDIFYLHFKDEGTTGGLIDLIFENGQVKGL